MNYKDALYLAIKYMLDEDLTTQDIVRILQVSNERFKEFMSEYE